MPLRSLGGQSEASPDVPERCALKFRRGQDDGTADTPPVSAPAGTVPYRRRLLHRPARASHRVACAACARSRRVCSIHAVSASASAPIAKAGPDTGHGPRIAASRPASGRSSSAKPSRMPASPKNLPNERSTMMLRVTSPARLDPGGAVSTKASSTTSTPPCGSSSAAVASNTSRPISRPSGLFGLVTIATSASSRPPMSRTSVTLWPASAAQRACSL